VAGGAPRDVDDLIGLDAHVFVEALWGVTHNPALRRRLGDAGRARCVGAFSLAASGRAVGDLLLDCVGRAAAAPPPTLAAVDAPWALVWQQALDASVSRRVTAEDRVSLMPSAHDATWLGALVRTADMHLPHEVRRLDGLVQFLGGGARTVAECEAADIDRGRLLRLAKLGVVRIVPA
jgi:hypothetical protein